MLIWNLVLHAEFRFQGVGRVTKFDPRDKKTEKFCLPMNLGASSFHRRIFVGAGSWYEGRNAAFTLWQRLLTYTNQPKILTVSKILEFDEMFIKILQNLIHSMLDLNRSTKILTPEKY